MRRDVAAAPGRGRGGRARREAEIDTGGNRSAMVALLKRGGVETVRPLGCRESKQQEAPQPREPAASAALREGLIIQLQARNLSSHQRWKKSIPAQLHQLITNGESSVSTQHRHFSVYTRTLFRDCWYRTGNLELPPAPQLSLPVALVTLRVVLATVVRWKTRGNARLNSTHCCVVMMCPRP